jgi:ferredoxin-NADP reductase
MVAPAQIAWPGYVAGQHVDVRLTAEDGYQAQRSYSIASAPERDRRRGLAANAVEPKCRASEDWIQGDAG